MRAFTGRTGDGRATQVTRTRHGTKRDAQRLAAELDAKPQPHAAGRSVADAVNAWQEVDEPLWAQSTRFEPPGPGASIGSAGAPHISLTPSFEPPARPGPLW